MRVRRTVGMGPSAMFRWARWAEEGLEGGAEGSGPRSMTIQPRYFPEEHMGKMQDRSREMRFGTGSGTLFRPALAWCGGKDDARPHGLWVQPWPCHMEAQSCPSRPSGSSVRFPPRTWQYRPAPAPVKSNARCERPPSSQGCVEASSSPGCNRECSEAAESYSYECGGRFIPAS